MVAASACDFPSQKDLTYQTVEASSVLTSEIKATLLERTLYAPGGFLSQWPSSTWSPGAERNPDGFGTPQSGSFSVIRVRLGLAHPTSVSQPIEVSAITSMASQA